MSTYRNIKCGNCHYSFTEGYQLYDGPRVKLGYPLIKCPKCGLPNRTGLVPWSKFRTKDKVLFWIKTITYSIIIGGFIIVAAVLIACELLGFDQFDENPINLLLTFTFGACLGNLIMIKGSKNKIKEIETVINSPEFKSYIK